jgi:hypothetical protein
MDKTLIEVGLQPLVQITIDNNYWSLQQKENGLVPIFKLRFSSAENLGVEFFFFFFTFFVQNRSKLLVKETLYEIHLRKSNDSLPSKNIIFHHFLYVARWFSYYFLSFLFFIFYFFIF